MNGRLILLAIGCAAVAATGCTKKDLMGKNGRNFKVQISSTATPDQDPVCIKDGDFNAGKLAVEWTAPVPWLVQFDPTDVPCANAFIIHRNGPERCVIHQNDFQPGHYYKYVLIAGEVLNQDPGIAHSTGARGCAGLTKNSAASGSHGVKLFCLDLSTGVPQNCKTSQPARTLTGVSQFDDIYWKAGSDWTVMMDSGACVQQLISSSQPYCTVNSCPGAASLCTYTYKAKINGATTKPFQIQVNNR